MDEALPRILRKATAPRINREPSPLLATATPWLTVMLGSLSVLAPLIASAPVLPSLGFIVLLVWAQQRPGIFPIWAGFPLGLFDDLFSGQPFGSGALTWSLALFILDLVALRVPWRNWLQNWAIAVALVIGQALLAAALADPSTFLRHAVILLPQLLLAMLTLPLVGRLVAAFDRLRLAPLRRIDR